MPHDLTPDPDGNQTPIAPDGSDPLTAASAEAFLQRLADRDAKLDRQSFYGSPLAHTTVEFSVADNPRSAGEYLFLGAVIGDETGDAGDEFGAEVGVSTITGLIGHAIRLNGSAAGGGRGTWRISGHTNITIDSATNPAPVILDLRTSASADFASATTVDQYIEQRFSAVSASYVQIHFEYEFYHDSADDLYLAFRANPGSIGDLAVTAVGRLSVTQLSRVLP